MKKESIKIKDLARELGLTARVVIDRCRNEGLPVQNSITKLTSQQADLIRSWFEGDASLSAPPTST